MRDSIIIDMEYADYDIIDGLPSVERHHCLFGTADRQKADEDGLWVPLSPDHHRNGKISAHRCREMQRLLQIIAQLSYELEMLTTGKAGTRTQAQYLFRQRYGRSFI